MDYQVIARFGFVTPQLNNFGFGFTNEGIIKMPIRGDFEYNFHDKKYTGKMKPTDKAYEVTSMKTTPFTYIHPHTSLTPLPEEKNIVVVQIIDKLKHVSIIFTFIINIRYSRLLQVVSKKNICNLLK